jgi:heme-degrading monooxygenase HmoA
MRGFSTFTGRVNQAYVPGVANVKGMPMYSRIVTFTGASDIDAGVTYIRDVVAPVLRQQKGFRAVTASADRDGGLVAVMTLWETAEDRDASESAMEKARDEGQKIIGGQMTVELFEETLVELYDTPTLGSALLVRRLRMDPARVADNVDFFRREILPQIKAEPGLVGIRQLVNRETGEALVGSVWRDAGALRSAAESAARRQQAVADRVTFLEQSQREIVFMETA